MKPLVVLNVVGLTSDLLGHDAPNLTALQRRGGLRTMTTVSPAVTCSVQSTLLTGSLPRDHGVVGNGWYFRELSEVALWRQSNRLVTGEPVWEAARRRNPEFTCANMFWWFNMYSTADIGVTPRPMYLADGRKIPDCYAAPSELRDELTERFGTFPLFRFWGPATDITSTEWIARATMHVRQTRRPTLTLAYLPHLDYNLQRVGPNDPSIRRDVAQVDAICGELIEQAERDGANVLVLSEYGITPVERPVHINRALRQVGLIAVRVERGREQLDAGASAAFAVADHQFAHVYVADARRRAEVKALLEALPGVERVLDAETKPQFALDHPRSGELVAIARADSWFTYYFWLDDERAPDYARTVDIHRKPGYDPVELFLDPAIRFPKVSIGRRLASKALGFRALMDVIPLDAALVRGSHGRVTDDPAAGPLCISSNPDLLPAGPLEASDVKELMLQHIFSEERAAVGGFA
ncbi:MAG: alkaline phosphatase family protein [Candidatus Eremiobacteraeota bacterium]|nr:alkaline phosphatase family protein [Candidatus Eremiobacteraeota bacterium]